LGVGNGSPQHRMRAMLKWEGAMIQLPIAERTDGDGGW
jgi:hypothetical protein